ncbi:MAG: hypothetical protein CBB68_15370 [Rhodospirillaceae bacterium TMED8]|nr:hypothetical protein [Magnetovibrio sp.]OUT47803.1 MAG: hypothetical protein CBB68_15370 [Rhodospirillaceae bacterium TMED8]|tara:strand:- start:971 stop:1531 length:561 start_codon:yes stop_codon:yes gene_type:complete
MTIKLAVSGSAGTGKSSLAMALSKSLNLPYLEESFRSRCEDGLVFQDLSRAAQSLLIVELYSEAIDQVTKCSDGFVQDRCPIDFLAFWLHYGFWNEEKSSKDLFKRVQKDLSYYDRIIMLPWGVFDIQEDGVRSTNCWLQLKFQSLVEGLVNRLAPKDLIYWMPNDIDVRQERVDHVHNIINFEKN